MLCRFRIVGSEKLSLKSVSNGAWLNLKILDLPKGIVCDLPADVAMGVVHILDTTTNFEGAIMCDIVDCLSVNNPRNYGDEVVGRLVGAGGVDFTANFRCGWSCALRVVSNDSRLIDVLDYIPTADREYGTDPVISVLLSWCRWIRFNND